MSKSKHGKGSPLSIGAQNRVNAYNRGFKVVSAGCPMREFVPLRSWPASPFPLRQAELDALRDIPSRFV